MTASALPRGETTISGGDWRRAGGSHQENPESAPMKLEVLGTMSVPYKRFEALPVLTVSPKRVEAPRIVAEYFIFSLTCSAGIGFRRNW